MPIDPETTVRRSTRAVYRKLSDGEGAVLLNLDSAEYHGINETGALVWQHIADGPTFAGLIAALDEDLQDPPIDWSSEISDFVTDLAERNLVELHG